MVVERKFSIFKNCRPDPEKIIHQVRVHPGLVDKFRFVAKAAGDAVVVGLPEQLGIPVTGHLVEEGQDIRLPLLQLLDKCSGKGECAMEPLIQFF